VRGGHDLVEFARGLVANFRDLLLLRLDPTLAARIDKPEAVKQRLLEQSARLPQADWVHLAQRAAEHYAALERAPQPRWLLETQVVEYATLESRVVLSEILGRLQGASPKSAAPRSAGATAAQMAPRGSASGSAASVGPAAAGTEWTTFAARVRAHNIGLGTCLVDAIPELDGDALRLVFRPEHTFQREQVARADAIGQLAQIAREVYGRSLALSAIVRAHQDDEAALQKQASETVAPDADQDLARRARENPHLGRLLDGLES
jgi:DNA polymerase III gamma/tau subunit